MITVEDLSKSYYQKKGAPTSYALEGISLTISEGEIFGIVGMSGAGKSTLMRCLTCLERPTEGRIWVGEEEITALTGKHLHAARRKMGMIFQHFNLFSSRTALGNVLYPLELEGNADKSTAQELLKLVGLEGKENAYPASLSGGEKQRVAIARALANNPAVLFCDEATSALDPRTTRSILSLLLSLNKNLGITIVLITHEMEVVKQICTRIAVLEHGQIVEEGKTSDLFAAPQHPTTRHFMQNLTHDIPAAYLSEKKGAQLLHLGFRGEKSKQPILSRMIRQFDVEVNILLGGIDVLRETTVGNLVVELSGKAEEISAARLFLEQEGVICEPL